MSLSETWARKPGVLVMLVSDTLRFGIGVPLFFPPDQVGTKGQY